MSTKTRPIPPRLIDLMIEDATQGLSPQDEAELSAAIAQDEIIRVEAEAYAMAATAVELSLSQPSKAEALPDALRDRLIAASSGHVVPAPTSLKLTDTPASPSATTAAATPFSFTDGRMFGWYAAIAALVALAFVLAVEPTQPNDTTIADRLDAATLNEQYEALASEASTIAANWGFNTDDGDPAYASATGQVIWNTDEQAGYMKLAGLPVNDPTEIQYQLWIVDPSRDAEPIDGGVFDITAQGEVIVPIDAKLRCDTPTVFAITVEQPGGVVVSEGPLHIVAAVAQRG